MIFSRSAPAGIQVTLVVVVEGKNHAAQIWAEASFLDTLRRPKFVCAAFAKAPFVFLPVLYHRGLWGEQGDAGRVRLSWVIVIRPPGGVWTCFPSLVLTSIE